MSRVEQVRTIMLEHRGEPNPFGPAPVVAALEFLAAELDRVDRSIAHKIVGDGDLVDQWNRKGCGDADE